VDVGGVEFMTTHVRASAATTPNTVVVAAGDIIGATPLLSALFHDEPSIESMNLLGLQIASIGNHEFDEGVEELWRMQEAAAIRWTAARTATTSRSVVPLPRRERAHARHGRDVFPPYAIRSFGNARVAFIGLTLEGPAFVTVPSNVENVEFADEATQ